MVTLLSFVYKCGLVSEGDVSLLQFHIAKGPVNQSLWGAVEVTVSSLGALSSRLESLAAYLGKYGPYF